MSCNVVLVGFMGAGKSTVGRRVAERLGLAFVDSDAVIEVKAGKGISDIFAEDGEAAFRSLEKDVLLELVREEDLVIATGGGAFVDPNLRAALNHLGLTVHLDAPFDELWERIRHAKHRPLLAGRGARERTLALYTQRLAAYRSAQVRLDASRSVETVVEELVKIYHERGCSTDQKC